MNISTHYWSRHCHSYSLSQPLPPPAPGLSVLCSPAVTFKFVSCFSSSLSLPPSLAQIVSRSDGAPGYNQITAMEMEYIRNWHAAQCMCACEHAVSPKNRKVLEGFLTGQEIRIRNFSAFGLKQSLLWSFCAALHSYYVSQTLSGYLCTSVPQQIVKRKIWQTCQVCSNLCWIRREKLEWDNWYMKLQVITGGVGI